MPSVTFDNFGASVPFDPSSMRRVQCDMHDWRLWNMPMFVVKPDSELITWDAKGMEQAEP